MTRQVREHLGLVLQSFFILFCLVCSFQVMRPGIYVFSVFLVYIHLIYRPEFYLLLKKVVLFVVIMNASVR